MKIDFRVIPIIYFVLGITLMPQYSAAKEAVIINLPEGEVVQSVEVVSATKQVFRLKDAKENITTLTLLTEINSFSVMGIRFKTTKKWEANGKYFELSHTYLPDINQSVVFFDIYDDPILKSSRLRIIVEFKNKDKIEYWIKNIEKLK